MKDFKVEIGDINYELKFENEPRNPFKPLNLTIIRHYKEHPAWWDATQLIRFSSDRLKDKYYNRIRRRIYHNLANIDKLKEGRIRQYQVFNQLELEVLAAYLCEKKILFRIYAETVYYKTLYESKDKADYNAYFCYPVNKAYNRNYFADENNVNPLNKMYIRVYKGFHELNEAIKTCGKEKALENKYGIYL